ncbi:MAG: hypothetical protein LBR36_09745 [Bacteroidales bacterium]|nr:hypothetical protein [Bacteroidales bacterium]
MSDVLGRVECKGEHIVYKAICSKCGFGEGNILCHDFTMQAIAMQLFAYQAFTPPPPTT